jgi:hypothetical protein
VKDQRLAVDIFSPQLDQFAKAQSTPGGEEYEQLIRLWHGSNERLDLRQRWRHNPAGPRR